MTEPRSSQVAQGPSWLFILMLGLPGLLFLGLPYVVPLSDGTYTCERVGAPYATLAPPNVEVVDGRITEAYNSFEDNLTFSDMEKKYDFFWKSTLTVILNGAGYECSL